MDDQIVPTHLKNIMLQSGLVRVRLPVPRVLEIDKLLQRHLHKAMSIVPYTTDHTISKTPQHHIQSHSVG